MSIEELAGLLDLSENYLYKHFKRIRESYAKQNIMIYKVGKGSDAKYGIQYPWDREPIFDTDAMEYF